MTLIAKGGNGVKPIDEGTYLSRCIQVIDLGTQYSRAYDKESRKVMIRWELPSETTEETPGVVSAIYTMSLHEKSALRKMLEGWRSKKFSDTELKGFDLTKLVGLPCLITIVHDTGANGNTYANVGTVAALPKGMEVPEQINESLVVDLDTAEDLKKINDLPPFVQNIIAESREMDATGNLPEMSEFADCDTPDEDLPF